MKAVLFDFNGTMIDDDAVNEASWRAFVEGKIGRPITEAEFQQEIQGRNAQYSLRFFLGSELTADQCFELEEEKEIIYRRMTEERQLTFLPGLEIFLNRLKELNIKVNIGTAAGEGNIRFFFRYYSLGRWFDPDLVVYNDGKIKGKPAPDIYLKAAKRLGVDIRDCVVFEDSASGLEAGRRAGAGAVIRLNPTHNDKMEPGEVAAEFIDFTDIDRIFEMMGTEV